MTNVLYVCPEEDEDGDRCGSRLFAAPGGTKVHCPYHTNTIFVQVEEAFPEAFEYRDEDGKKSTRVNQPLPEGKNEVRTDLAPKPRVVPKSKNVHRMSEIERLEKKLQELKEQEAVGEGDEQEQEQSSRVGHVDDPSGELSKSKLTRLREKYQEVFGERPDMRYKENRLEGLIEAELMTRDAAVDAPPVDLVDDEE